MTGDPGPAQVAGFLEYFQISGRARGLVSAFFRLHPFLPLPREPFLDFGTLVEHGETVYVDLTQTREDMDGQMRAGHISDVYRLRREGYRVELDAWDRLDEFIRIYTQTMARHSASPFYFFGDDYFHSLRAALGDRLRLALVLAPGGTTVCGALFMEEGGFLEYHLSGTEEAFVKLGASKLLIVHMRDWAKERGDQLFHLGGGVGAQADSLFAFKKGFSRLRSSFCSFRMIVDDAAYAELTKWGRGSPERKLMERRRYFPGYRRPA
jgi:lipid II:glycine glycyltransferase (peptidoglycan interpeptide bridge formation enzyme)